MGNLICYDPLKVICAIRIKVENILYNQMELQADKDKLIKIHTTIKKLQYAETVI